MAVEVIKSVKIMHQRSATLRRSGERIGFVPTMGGLHEGHLSLVDIARNRSEIVVMSVFVNPTQFAEGEDLDKYPRDFNRDLRLARERDVDILFYPSAEDVYPSSFRTEVQVTGLSKLLCGTTRPEHFKGVTTVVAKLFNIVQPDEAYFGQKDAQQAILIQQMVKDLNFPIDIIVGPIIRESDGLALSSRNVYLSDDERKQAVSLSTALIKAKKTIESGERNSKFITRKIRSVLSEQPDIQIDYVEIVNLKNLQPVETIDGPVLVAVAAFVGTTRLIDNIIIDQNESNTLKIENP
jgi:pantoate--beta-alanine ligase